MGESAQVLWQWQGSPAVSMSLVTTQSLLLKTTKMRKYQMHWRFFPDSLPFLLIVSPSALPLLPFPPLFTLAFPSSHKTMLRVCYIPSTLGLHKWIRFTLCYFKAHRVHYNFIALYKEYSHTGEGITISLLQMKKLEHKEVKWIVQYQPSII